MKQLIKVWPFTFLLIACGAEVKKQDSSKVVLGNWALTTYERHVLEIGKDSIYNKEHGFYSTYRLFSDSIEMKTKKFASIEKYALSFIGNDTLILNGPIDGIHVYKRIKNR